MSIIARFLVILNVLYCISILGCSAVRVGKLRSDESLLSDYENADRVRIMGFTPPGQGDELVSEIDSGMLSAKYCSRLVQILFGDARHDARSEYYFIKQDMVISSLQYMRIEFKSSKVHLSAVEIYDKSIIRVGDRFFSSKKQRNIHEEVIQYLRENGCLRYRSMRDGQFDLGDSKNNL